ncbi:hypothetical protein T01_16146 [Trichinella spiralis]|uniref:Uncharacterized protein n=1 Tax=Trichinella spiralis TaxID=6334 RepID=A0A0V1BLC2_TRISP|nr:hypothetical protein T01_16146 [Trichinella spiralis]
MKLTNGDEIQFVSNQKNQQKLIYRGRCFTLKRTKNPSAAMQQSPPIGKSRTNSNSGPSLDPRLVPGAISVAIISWKAVSPPA